MSKEWERTRVRWWSSRSGSGRESGGGRPEAEKRGFSEAGELGRGCMSVQERERSRARGGRAGAGVDERAEVGDLELRSGAAWWATWSGEAGLLTQGSNGFQGRPQRRYRC